MRVAAPLLRSYPPGIVCTDPLLSTPLVRLYHELTDALEAFVNDPSTHRAPLNLPALFTEFVQPIASKLNQVRLVTIATAASGQFDRPADAHTFLASVAAAPSVHASHEAALLCTMQLVRLQLLQGDAFHADVKSALDTLKPTVEALVGAEPVVHAAYYRAACAYYSAVGPADRFYKNALMFLAYAPYDELPASERFTLAVDLSIAALTGENVFNFGEVLATPALQALDGTDKHWLAQLLLAFNRGDIDAFNALVHTHQREFDAQPALHLKAAYVKEKLALLALMVLVFQRPSHARTLRFDEIAAATRLPPTQVEWLVMRALACGLVKGAIDQVDEVVRVSWVQPRVLDSAQLQELVNRLDGWEKKVHSTLLYVEEQTPELFQ